MRACPACGTATTPDAERCSQCGEALPNGRFETSVPATRRMGHTMLGVAPASALSKDATDESHRELPSDETTAGAFQPFAPVPGTLTGLSPEAIRVEDAASPADAATRPATSTVDPSKTLPMAHSRTLVGFAAIPGEVGGAPATERGLSPKSALAAASDGNAASSAPSQTSGPAALANATLLGVSPLAKGAPSSPLQPTAGDGDPNATLRGARPFDKDNPPQPQTDGIEKRQFKGTLLGVSPMLAQSPNAAGGTGAVPALTSDDPSATATPVVAAKGHATMLGVAPMMSPPVATAALPPATQQLSAATVPQVPGHKGTLLGVAMPGIAPLQPGQLKAPAGAPVQVAGSAAPRVERPVFPEVSTEDNTDHTRAVQRKRLAWIFGIAAAFLLAIVVVALGLWWTSVHLSVEVTSAENGNERLVLTCTNCPDGTKAAIESRSSEFRDKRAILELPRRLAIGKNALRLDVIRPNRPRGETVAVTVPVEFRVTSSIAELDGTPPCITVLLEALPGTAFVVDGKATVIGQTGQARLPVDVSELLGGQAASVVSFERKIDYRVTREELNKQGTLVVRSGITPLEVVTPGLSHITANATFTLSGRTNPLAKLTANGHNIAVGPDGTFHQEMALSSPGATKLYVRAKEPNQAPRLVEIALERVTNLKQRADELARPLTSSYDKIVELAEKTPDQLVALHLELLAIETAGASTRLVGTSDCTHSPCLSSIRYGGLLAFHRGDRLIVLGIARLTHRSNSTDRDLAIEASLVMQDTRP